MDVPWLTFVLERLPELWLRTGEHLLLTGVSTGVAILIGIPLGICAARFWWLRSVVTGGVGILQTIPSLAMLAILLTLLGRIGALPAIIALTLYALLPIVRNTLTGLEGIAPEILEAAEGIGMTRQQRLRLVELPLSTPVIVAGIRTAAVVSVGIATLSAFIGAGGLGQFINRGLALSNTHLILLGAIPSALLALAVDASIAAFQWGLRRKRSTRSRLKATLDPILRPLALTLPAMLAVAGGFAYFSAPATHSSPGPGGAPGVVRIGSKNFTEQMILSELMAQLIERHTDLAVERRFNLGGTMICHEALASGEIDLYPEYTGTALTAILQQPVVTDPGQALGTVAQEYRRRFSIAWLRPFGFNNTYAMTVRNKFAEAHSLRSISDLVPIAHTLRAGFTAEFSERPDGYPGLSQAYGLHFKEVRDLDPALMYPAIAGSEVDVICAFATDGRIAAFDLQPLQDDRKFFPPYEAAPVIRSEILDKYPELREVLELLAGSLSSETMQRLNHGVDEEKRQPREVAREFLQHAGLLSKRDRVSD